MKIRMKRPYGSYKAGEVVDVTDDLAGRLVAWEYATEDRQRDLLVETATDEPQSETADATPKQRRRK